MSSLNPYRIAAMVLLTLFSALISLVQFGGLIVFGPIPIVAVPMLIFPICMVGWWNAKIAAVLGWIQTILFYGILMGINWPKVGGAFGGPPIDYSYPLNAAVLTGIAIYDIRARRSALTASQGLPS
jgi:hypothetical protein